MKYSVLSCIHSKSEFHDSLYIRCLDSLVNQSFKDFDVIIVLDECWEQTENIVNSYLNKLNIIKIVKNNLAIGHANAKNIGIEFLESDYTIFTDADDWSDIDRFQKQIEFIENNNVDFLGCMVKVFNIDGSFSHDLYYKKQYETHDQIVYKIQSENMIAHGSLIVKTNKLKELMYNKDIKYGEDWDLYKRAINSGSIFHILQERLYNYTIGSSTPFNK